MLRIYLVCYSLWCLTQYALFFWGCVKHPFSVIFSCLYPLDVFVKHIYKTGVWFETFSLLQFTFSILNKYNIYVMVVSSTVTCKLLQFRSFSSAVKLMHVIYLDVIHIVILISNQFCDLNMNFNYIYMFLWLNHLKASLSQYKNFKHL